MPCRPSYSCRQFRRRHVEFVDGLLPGEAQDVCEAHVRECPVCAEHDVQVRRSLLALQVLPTIMPSADFRDRLRARLAGEAPTVVPAVASASELLAARTRFLVLESAGVASLARFDATHGEPTGLAVLPVMRRPMLRSRRAD